MSTCTGCGAPLVTSKCAYCGCISGKHEGPKVVKPVPVKDECLSGYATKVSEIWDERLHITNKAEFRSRVIIAITIQCRVSAAAAATMYNNEVLIRRKPIPVTKALPTEEATLDAAIGSISLIFWLCYWIGGLVGTLIFIVLLGSIIGGVCNQAKARKLS